MPVSKLNLSATLHKGPFRQRHLIHIGGKRPNRRTVKTANAIWSSQIGNHKHTGFTDSASDHSPHATMRTKSSKARHAVLASPQRRQIGSLGKHCPRRRPTRAGRKSQPGAALGKTGHLSELDTLPNPFAKFDNFFQACNSNRSNYLPINAAYSPDALRLPAGYNMASGGPRESEFAPRKAHSGHHVPCTLG